MLTEDRLEAHSHTIYGSLTSSEKDQWLSSLQDSLKQSEKQLQGLKEKLERVLDERAISDKSINDDIMTVVSEDSARIW